MRLHWALIIAFLYIGPFTIGCLCWIRHYHLWHTLRIIVHDWATADANHQRHQTNGGQQSGKNNLRYTVHRKMPGWNMTRAKRIRQRCPNGKKLHQFPSRQGLLHRTCFDYNTRQNSDGMKLFSTHSVSTHTANLTTQMVNHRLPAIKVRKTWIVDGNWWWWKLFGWSALFQLVATLAQWKIFDIGDGTLLSATNSWWQVHHWWNGWTRSNMD
jgi:hypothetical protein